jgi:hypothetical protein
MSKNSGSYYTARLCHDTGLRQLRKIFKTVHTRYDTSYFELQLVIIIIIIIIIMSIVLIGGTGLAQVV